MKIDVTNPEHLKRFLSRVAMTQREFAEYVGMTESAISHYMHGRRKIKGAIKRLFELAIESIECEEQWF